MTLPANPRRNDYTGNGSTNVYDYDFKIYDEDYLRVVVADLAGVEYPDLVLGVDYSVDGVLDEDGGSITLINAAQAWLTAGDLTTGFTIAIIGNMPIEQLMSIRNQGTFYPADIEDGVDQLCAMVQELLEKLNRAILLPASFSLSGFTIDPPVANEFLVWDSTATKITSVAVAPSSATSVYGEALAGALDNSNVTFVAANIPTLVKALYVNGARRTDYTRITDTFTLSGPAGFAGEVLLDYDY